MDSTFFFFLSCLSGPEDWDLPGSLSRSGVLLYTFLFIFLLIFPCLTEGLYSIKFSARLGCYDAWCAVIAVFPEVRGTYARRPRDFLTDRFFSARRAGGLNAI